MKMFTPLLCLLSLVLAEPPVGDSYAAAGRSSHNHDHSDLQRSPSQEYGIPSQGFGTRNSLSTAYGPPSKPSARLSQNYGSQSSRISQEYGVPNSRKSQNAISRISQEYGTPNSRSSPSQEYGLPNSRSTLSQEYGIPNSRSSPSEEYGLPNSRNSISYEHNIPSSRSNPSQEYGIPNVRSNHAQDYSSTNSFSSRAPSSQYGAPEFHVPSEEYNTPQKNSNNARKSQKQPSFRNPQHQTLSQNYGAPSTRAKDISQAYSAPKNAFKSASRSLSQTYGAPKSGLSQAPSTSYGVPSIDSYTQDFGSVTDSYNVPSQRDLSDTYGAPLAKGLSEEYTAPEHTADLKTNAVASSYSSARSSPSSSYGVPSARDAMPSEHYGVPEQYNALSNQGYEYARRALNEEDQEPANYDFAYKVNDYLSGSDFGHTESRQDNHAEGTYFVVLPDGTKQVVEYQADERGFKPRISVEPADVARSGGYDENASNLGRSSEGPY